MTTPVKPNEVAVPSKPDEIREVLSRAAKGDTATLPAVRKLLQNPANIDSMGGNLARYAEDLFAKALSGKDLSVSEAILAKMAAMRKELLGENATPVEVLLVERTVACWLQVQDADIRYASAKKDLNIRQADYHQRRMDSANRRYLSALKALALVRKLAVPALQVNIARRQVNISTPSAAVAGY